MGNEWVHDSSSIIQNAGVQHRPLPPLSAPYIEVLYLLRSLDLISWEIIVGRRTYNIEERAHGERVNVPLACVVMIRGKA
jgi:hypothetical protein